jgi:putative photosynthetic complex assembly protein 2
MIEVAGPIAAAVVLWWASTGVILYLDGLPKRTFKWSLLALSIIGFGAVIAIAHVRSETSAIAAYIGFCGGLLIWAVPTAAFYFGVVTGPRNSSLPQGITGLARFRAAVETMVYHELLCVACALLLGIVTWSAPNQLALWTYLLLWAMHVSGKLNMFFGVPNLSEEFLPPHLAHLATYMRKRPMNLLFPLSVSLATLATGWFAFQAWHAQSGSFEAVGATLLAVLAGLAVLEHWLLVLPLAPMALWNWSLKSRATQPSPDTATATPGQ